MLSCVKGTFLSPTVWGVTSPQWPLHGYRRCRGIHTVLRCPPIFFDGDVGQKRHKLQVYCVVKADRGTFTWVKWRAACTGLLNPCGWKRRESESDRWWLELKLCFARPDYQSGRAPLSSALLPPMAADASLKTCSFETSELNGAQKGWDGGNIFFYLNSLLYLYT